MPMQLDLSAAAARSPAQPAALTVAVDAEPDAIDLDAPSIAIEFSAFNDGRGLSLAVLLREQYGYQGELHATGELIPDMIHYLRRCRFDRVTLPERFTAAEIEAASAPHKAYYQGSASDPEPAFRRTSRSA
ncbi:MAG: DUF934 domain-containing protein [Pseudomonadota bacterium]